MRSKLSYKASVDAQVAFEMSCLMVLHDLTASLFDLVESNGRAAVIVYESKTPDKKRQKRSKSFYKKGSK